MNPKYIPYINKNYEKFIRAKPCFICGQRPTHGHHWFHARSTSILLVPLCLDHHTRGNDSYHVLEVNRFEDHHGIKGEFKIINYLTEYIQILEEKLKCKKKVGPLEQLERE